MGETPRNEDRLAQKLGLFAVIIADLLGYVGAGLGIGYLLEWKLGAPRWVLLVTGSAGLGLAFYRLYLVAKREMTK